MYCYQHEWQPSIFLSLFYFFTQGQTLCQTGVPWHEENKPFWWLAFLCYNCSPKLQATRPMPHSHWRLTAVMQQVETSDQRATDVCTDKWNQFPHWNESTGAVSWMLMQPPTRIAYKRTSNSWESDWCRLRKQSCSFKKSSSQWLGPNCHFFTNRDYLQQLVTGCVTTTTLTTTSINN